MFYENRDASARRSTSGNKSWNEIGYSTVLALVSALILCSALSAFPIPPAERKIVRRVEPIYPSLARSLHLTGVVKLHLIVGPDGNVKSAEPVGGHPVLIEAFLNAVEKWKFEAGPKETKVTVEFKFSPD